MNEPWRARAQWGGRRRQRCAVALYGVNALRGQSAQSYEMYSIERNAERTATAGRLLYDISEKNNPDQLVCGQVGLGEALLEAETIEEQESPVNCFRKLFVCDVLPLIINNHDVRLPANLLYKYLNKAAEFYINYVTRSTQTENQHQGAQETSDLMSPSKRSSQKYIIEGLTEKSSQIVDPWERLFKILNVVGMRCEWQMDKGRRSYGDILHRMKDLCRYMNNFDNEAHAKYKNQVVYSTMLVFFKNAFQYVSSIQPSLFQAASAVVFHRESFTLLVAWCAICGPLPDDKLRGAEDIVCLFLPSDLGLHTAPEPQRASVTFWLCSQALALLAFLGFHPTVGPTRCRPSQQLQSLITVASSGGFSTRPQCPAHVTGQSSDDEDCPAKGRNRHIVVNKAELANSIEVLESFKLARESWELLYSLEFLDKGPLLPFGQWAFVPGLLLSPCLYRALVRCIMSHFLSKRHIIRFLLVTPRIESSFSLLAAVTSKGQYKKAIASLHHLAALQGSVPQPQISGQGTLEHQRALIQLATCHFALGEYRTTCEKVLDLMCHMVLPIQDGGKPQEEPSKVKPKFRKGSDLKLLPCTSKAIMPYCLHLMLACFKLRAFTDSRDDMALGHVIVLLQQEWPRGETLFLKAVNIDMLEEFAYLRTQEGGKIHLELLPNQGMLIK
ncbi:integrator complex subunit 10 isoform 2 [Camelus ferus]|nr:integrator complex subunit 10 isoform 2 [Camelus ferus]